MWLRNVLAPLLLMAGNCFLVLLKVCRASVSDVKCLTLEYDFCIRALGLAVAFIGSRSDACLHRDAFLRPERV